MQISETKFRSLSNNEVIRNGDIVEDILTGERIPVKNGKFYSVLRGTRVEHAKQLPSVWDIIRIEQ